VSGHQTTPRGLELNKKAEGNLSLALTITLSPSPLSFPLFLLLPPSFPFSLRGSYTIDSLILRPSVSESITPPTFLGFHLAGGILWNLVCISYWFYFSGEL
jgi:hypothetical protein